MAHSSTFRRVIVGVAAIVFLFSSSMDLRAQGYQRGVFVEEFTGTWCGYCPRGAWYMDSLAANMPDNAILVAWHNGDLMTIANGEAVMAKNWAIAGYPNVLVNRYDYNGGVGDWADFDPNSIDQIYPLVIQPSAQSAPILNFQLTNITFAPVTKTVSFDLLVSPMVPGEIPTEDTAEYRTVVVLTEDSVIYDQNNYSLRGLPTTLKKFQHDNVARMVSGNVLGNKFNMLTTTPNAQYPVTIHYSMKITTASFKPGKMRIKTMVETVAPVGTTPQAHIVRDAAQSNYLSSYPGPKLGTIAITKPAAGDVVIGGTTGQEIDFTATSEVTSSKTFSYSVDGGTNWNLIATISSNATNYMGWNVPKTATTQAMIKIVDANGATATSGIFTIKVDAPGPGSITGLTLGGVVNNHIDKDMPLPVSWTATGDVGSKVIAEFSLDDATTWHAFDTVASTVTSTNKYRTPKTYFPKCFIRVISADADKQTIQMTSDQFAIDGFDGGVYSSGSVNGYSITNYPNPFSGETTIKFELAKSGSVTLSVRDELGREISRLVTETLGAGSHNVPFNASNLSNGIYTYTLEAGTTKLVGKMSVVK